MSREQQIKDLLKSNNGEIPNKTELEKAEVNELVDECVTVDESFYIHTMSSKRFSSHSRKPSNIKVEFDIGASFELLAQGGYLSGESAGIFAGVMALCSLVSRKTKIDLEPETGFVYWVAYDNRQYPWEIPKHELVELATEKAKTKDVHFDLTEDEVKQRIQRLCQINSFNREYKNGKEYLILRERCSSDWEI